MSRKSDPGLEELQEARGEEVTGRPSGPHYRVGTHPSTVFGDSSGLEGLQESSDSGRASTSTGPGAPGESWGDPVDGGDGEDFGLPSGLRPPPDQEELPQEDQAAPNGELRKLHRDQFAVTKSQQDCGIGLVPKDGGGGCPEIRRDSDGSCWIFGVQNCASPYCPVCSERLARKRAEELERAIELHQERPGHQVYFLTLTLPHHQGQSCSDVREGLMESIRYLFSGSPWGRYADRTGYMGRVRAAEVTVGSSGFHWHAHIVLFTRELEERELRDCYVQDQDLEGGDGPGGQWRKSLLCWMRDRWEKRVTTFHLEDGELETWNLNRKLPSDFDPFFEEPSRHHGVQLEEADGGAGEYMTKLGLAREETRVDVKRARGDNRTPKELLASYYVHRRPADARLYQEYLETVKGKTHLHVSPEIREEYYGRPESEQEELDLVEEAEEEDQEESELVVSFGRSLWGTCTSIERDFPENVCRVAEDGGLSAVADYIAGLIAAGPEWTAGDELRVHEDRRHIELWSTWKDDQGQLPAEEPEPVVEQQGLELFDSIL